MMTNKDVSRKKTRAAGRNVKERDYWLNTLSGEWVKGAFPYDRLERDEHKALEKISTRFEGEDFSNLMRLSNGSGHRLFMILISQLFLLLYKYTGSRDIVVGTPIVKQETEGDFINTVLALRNRIDPGMTFKELLLQVRQTIVAAAEHQNYPIEVLLHKLKLKEDGGRFPLFDIAVLLEDIHDRDYLRHIRTNMVFTFRQTEGAVEGLLEYNSSFYTAAAAEGIIRHYRYLVANMMTRLDSPVSDTVILSEKEKKQLLVDFNNTEGEYPEGKTIHQLFEEQAHRTPDNIALHMSYRIDMTYNQLNREASQLAQLLKEKGVGPDVIVGLMMDRSMEMIIAVLGILKAGGAYLPIDINYPEERKEYMLANSGVGILVSNDIEVIDLAGMPQQAAPTQHTQPTQLCYVIYTSGSTGRPKGVMLEHRHVVNLIHFDFVHTNLDFSKVLQFHTIGFDASFHEIFCALLSGGTLYLIDEETRADIPALFELVKKNGIVTLFLPMSYLRMIFNEESYVRMIPHCVRHIQTAGEQVVINNLFRRYLRENHVYLHNHYGPAETHVVTALTLDPAEEIPELPSIGKPILNSSISILDKEQQLLPVGVPGELYIGGIQVGRGYLDRPELTAERFNRSYKSYRTYKTGDLARWLPDGNIEFLGRVDKQVKIRGFRVEPGEIESRLIDLGHIKAAAVVDRTDEKGDKFLCAYVVSDNEIETSALRGVLGKTLPDYMIPSYFIQLDEIPLTPNGKVDRDTLQAIEITTGIGAYAPPRNEVEENLCVLWTEILGLEKETIGIDDNFFQLGGHSLKATILISRIHKAFNVRISLGEIFNQPSIRELGEYINGARRENFIAVTPAEHRRYYPMSSSQKRMYILNQLEKGSTNYNMPAALLVAGDINQSKFESVFSALSQRQEGLRTRFVVVGGEPVQEIVPGGDAAFAVPYEDASGKTDIKDSSHGVLQEKFLDPFVRPFDLAQAPLLRVGLVKLAEKKHLLMVDIHHIIGDGMSLGVLVREFTQLYEGRDIPPLTIQYKDYAVWQQGLVVSGELKKQEEYWLQELEGDIPVLDLPLDYPRPAMMSFEGEWLEFWIPAETTAKLNELAKQNRVTLYMLLLAAYNVLLYKYTGSETILVGSAIAGRSHHGLENIIGVFLNTLVLKNKLNGSLPFGEFLHRVGKNALRAFDNQEYQFEELVEKLDFKRDYSRNPIFDTMFNFHNVDIPEVKFSDLTLTPIRPESTAVKLDIKLMAWEWEDRLRCTVDYCTKLFRPGTMETFVENFLKIIDTVVENPTVNISEIQLMSEEAKVELMEDFSEELDYEF
ncbi:MAG: amino acid adenylation domain-containing protein [bacterium]|nr:amino acid adenylation domain-containing protein [bacterium]